MELNFLKTAKGKNLLVHNRYTFTKEKNRADSKIIWKCSQYASKKCRGRCHTQSNNVVWDFDNHTHLPEVSRLAAIQFISEIKENATTFTSTSASVLASTSKELPREIISYVPKIDSLKRTIQRVRKKEFPTLRPNCVEELTIPDIYQVTDKKEKFLYFDSGSENIRVLVFCTKDNLKILKKCSQWYADGTFKSAPPLFNQFFVIHGKLNDGSIFPLIYSIMTHRTEQAYDILFNFLADELGEFEPESIMTDFEILPAIFCRITINKLCARVEKSDSIIEKMYIYYEKAKCHMDLGSDNLKKARNTATKCLQLAKEINNHTWTVNALILLVSIEFQLDNKPKCCNILYKAMEIANNLQVPGVIMFLDKVAKMIFETKAVHISRTDKKIMEVLNFMPDISARMNAMFKLKRLSTMPINL